MQRDAAQEQADAAHRVAEAVEDAEERQREAVDRVIEAQANAVEAQQQGQQRIADAHEQANERRLQAEEALSEAMVAAGERQAAAHRRVQDANRALTDAQNQAAEERVAAEKRVQDTQEALSDSLRNQQGTYRSHAELLAHQRELQMLLNDETIDGETKNRLLKEELIRLGNYVGGPLGQVLIDHANRLYTIDNINPTSDVHVNGLDEGIIGLDRLLDQMLAVDGKTVNATVNVAGQLDLGALGEQPPGQTRRPPRLQPGAARRRRAPSRRSTPTPTCGPTATTSRGRPWKRRSALPCHVRVTQGPSDPSVEPNPQVSGRARDRWASWAASGAIGGARCGPAPRARGRAAE